MKTNTLLFVVLALFFTNIASANSTSANFSFKESKDDFKISDTDIIPITTYNALFMLYLFAAKF